MLATKVCSVRFSILVLHCLAFEFRALSLRGYNCNRIQTMPTHRIPTILSRRFGVEGQESISKHPSVPKVWNLKGLKQEVSRRELRAFKKVAKAHEKIAQLEDKVNDMEESPESSIESSLLILAREELISQQEQLESLKDLAENLTAVKSTTDPFFQAMLADIESLDLKDEAPVRPAQIPRVKLKQAATGPRLPYHKYESIDGIEIRVGKGAEDNDQLSCNREYRDGANWWMHVAGCPGSHVVIRSTEENLLLTHKQTVMDAALLTAIHSKAGTGRIQVSLTRCRNVSKPPGAKPGLVQLRGDIHTITVDTKTENKRLERLKRL